MMLATKAKEEKLEKQLEAQKKKDEREAKKVRAMPPPLPALARVTAARSEARVTLSFTRPVRTGREGVAAQAAPDRVLPLREREARGDQVGQPRCARPLALPPPLWRVSEREATCSADARLSCRARQCVSDVAAQAKLLGAAWKELSAEDRTEFEQKAVQDRARYEAEVSEALLPPA